MDTGIQMAGRVSAALKALRTISPVLVNWWPTAKAGPSGTDLRREIVPQNKFLLPAGWEKVAAGRMR
jgi:hypothetical protein